MVTLNLPVVLKKVTIVITTFWCRCFDENAIHTGKSYAKEASWTSPRKAILGGAKFIRTNYFDNDQITLYQMRWNPKSPANISMQAIFCGQIKLQSICRHIMTNLV